MKGKKQYKNDKFAKCDNCGSRVYKENQRHYKDKYCCSTYFGWPTTHDEVFCDFCDREGLKKHLEKLNEEGLLKGKKNET
jgi:acetyl-CoA carboxylase beta subunit